MEQILNHLWNDTGFHCLGLITKDGHFAHKWVKADQTPGLIRWAEGKGLDLYYGLATFDAERRTQALVKSVRGFWLDLDCGEGKDYPDQKAAFAALRTFVKDNALPRPWVVSSGIGLHVYWLTRTYSRQEWRGKAIALADMCASSGFKVDRACTTDCARVLRPVGSWNFKRGGKAQVTVLVQGEGELELPDAPAPAEPMQYTTVGDGNWGIISTNCIQLAQIVSIQGNVEEPVRYAVQSVMRHCGMGPSEAAPLFAGRTSVTAEELETKFAQLERNAIGPTTCARFQQLRPEGCEGCPLSGLITSPIQATPPTEKPLAVITTPEHTIINKRWVINASGVSRIPDEDGESDPIPILDVPLRFIEVGQTASDSGATVQWTTSQGVKHTKLMPLTTIAEPASAKEWLLRNAIIPIGDVKHFMKYGTDALRDLLQNSDPTAIVDQFGWRGQDAFALGNRLITADGVLDGKIDNTVPGTMVRALASKGSLDKWTAATALLDTDDYRMHAFAVLCALASPMLTVMDVQGCVLSLAGPANTGKTTAMNYGMSAYGAPSGLVFSPDSSQIARGIMLRCAGNLPVGLDDLSRRTRDVNGLMYMVANGQDKVRGRIDGSARDAGSWRTVMIVTTNYPLMDLDTQTLGEAERRRVIEVPVFKPLSREVAMELNRVMQENHGVAAEPILRYIIQHWSALRDKALAYWNELASDKDIPEANRFGIWLLTAAKIVGDIATELGAIRFDAGKTMAAAINAFKNHAAMVVESVITPTHIQELMAQFMTEHNSQLTRYRGGRFENIEQIDRSLKIVGCIDFDNNVVRIPIATVKEYAAKHHIPLSSLREWAKVFRVDSINKRISPDLPSVRSYAVPGLATEEQPNE